MDNNTALIAGFLLDWFDEHGRKNLPWQNPKSPYAVWISEIMLQQTQVQTVIPYFQRFIARFPDIDTLAQASEDEVLAYWSGLGYYTRARNIHRCAQIVVKHHHSQFPQSLEQITALPGIGRTTAAAICSQAYDQSTAILDANVKRVLSRLFLIDGPTDQVSTQKKLWQKAEECMPKIRCADYTQAIMDLGAGICKSRNPDCAHCPLSSSCLAYLNQSVSDYPAKKIKRSVPVRKQKFLILFNHEKKVYLEKRADTGIWGGLWCCFVLEAEQEIDKFISTQTPYNHFFIEPLLSLSHRFTHFLLEIEAFSVDLSFDCQPTLSLPGQWFHQKDLQKVGLATPVQKIMNAFFRSRTENL